MARPQAEIINSIQVTDQFGIDILAAKSLYAIVYRDKPFSIRHRYWGIKGEFPKYIRTVFPHKSSAENLAKKLNEHFITDEFVVAKIL
jgi:hypothetical protein